MSKIAQYHLHKLNPGKLQFEVYDLREYRIKSGDKAAVPHSHSYYQIIWFFTKGGTHSVDFRTYDINKDTILFITKDQIHCFDENLEIEGWLIHFNESFFMHTDVDIFLKYNIFKTQENPCYALEHKTIETAKNYMSLIIEELSNRNRFGFENAIQFLLKCLLINLERVHQHKNEGEMGLSSAYELQFYQFKELIEENYKNNLSVKEYADAMYISTKTLTTITKTISQTSPAQIIAERVVLQAKRLLRFTSLQIGEVAFQLGFEDPSYFVKYFKRHVNMSPNIFRNLK